MTLKAEFEQCAENVKKVKTRPTDQELLDLYGLYKQVIVGDVNIDKPGMTDLKGKAKWEAWNSRKGMSNEDAMNAYISLAKETIEKAKVTGAIPDLLLNVHFGASAKYQDSVSSVQFIAVSLSAFLQSLVSLRVNPALKVTASSARLGGVNTNSAEVYL
ncbi:hypothetical protein Q8A67_007676 [Cirrhinus molitorella]|uniref:ACB domain-containing protein n=1 Tax=Cirrhinus molitorella TaxID=172907 RepID=A0AA88TQ16_9TELE|nr:hypothetical protein Q8A67_007676 [Cirrhinus molitorella]